MMKRALTFLAVSLVVFVVCSLLSIFLDGCGPTDRPPAQGDYAPQDAGAVCQGPGDPYPCAAPAVCVARVFAEPDGGLIPNGYACATGGAPYAFAISPGAECPYRAAACTAGIIPCCVETDAGCDCVELVAVY